LLPGKKPGSRPALIPLFAKKFFHAVRTRGDTNEVDRTNILAPGFRRRFRDMHLLPAFTARDCGAIGPWEVVSSYSSATAPGSNGISCADPLIKLAKNCAQE